MRWRADQDLVSHKKVINLLLKFIFFFISPRYTLVLQVYTTPAQYLHSAWSSPLKHDVCFIN